MPKINVKLIFTLFIIFLILLSSICFATNVNDGIMLISNTENEDNNSLESRYSDLYITGDSDYDIKNTIYGNVFATVGTLNVDSSKNGGIISRKSLYNC